MITEREPFDSPELTPLDLCLWGWKKSETYSRKQDTPDELLARNLDVAVHIRKHEDQLRPTTCDLRARVAKCVGAGGGICEH